MQMLAVTLMGSCRGYTRKEPFANGIWTPKAENWNGRVAMLGFTGIVITEALAGKSVLEVNQMLLASSCTPIVALCNTCCLCLFGSISIEFVSSACSDC